MDGRDDGLFVGDSHIAGFTHTAGTRRGSVLGSFTHTDTHKKCHLASRDLLLEVFWKVNFLRITLNNDCVTMY